MPLSVMLQLAIFRQLCVKDILQPVLPNLMVALPRLAEVFCSHRFWSHVLFGFMYSVLFSQK